MLIVQKYGGTSLAGMSRLRAAARRVTGLARQGNQVVVVVSAQGDTTDMLIEKATQVNRRGSAREMDAYLAAGEQMSAGLMTMAIGAMGYSAVSLTGWQAGIRTDGVHGNARIQNIDVARIRRQLDAGKIVVVAGRRSRGGHHHVGARRFGHHGGSSGGMAEGRPLSDLHRRGRRL